jgi:hypothetical protein
LHRWLPGKISLDWVAMKASYHAYSPCILIFRPPLVPSVNPSHFRLPSNQPHLLLQPAVWGCTGFTCLPVTFCLHVIDIHAPSCHVEQMTWL